MSIRQSENAAALAGPNVRIARQVRTNQGALIRNDVLGSWYITEADGARLAWVRRELVAAQAEEPWAGWKLEARGTERGWHEWEN